MLLTGVGRSPHVDLLITRGKHIFVADEGGGSSVPPQGLYHSGGRQAMVKVLTLPWLL